MTTHERWFSPPRSPTIVGSAVATIVWSSAASSITSISPPKTSLTFGALVLAGYGDRGDRAESSAG